MKNQKETCIIYFSVMRELAYFYNISRILEDFVKLPSVLTLKQGRSQEFCLGGVSHWRRQISNFSYLAQRSFWCHWSIFGLLQQDITSNIFYQSASINFNKDKKTFAFVVIIIQQLLTKQFSMNINE